MSILTVHCDARVRDGAARFGWVLSLAGKRIASGSYAPPGTEWLGTQAEMYAVIAGALAVVEELRERPLWLTGVEFISDSQSVIAAILGEVTMRDPEMETALDQLRAICEVLPNPRFTWIPRNLNQEADWLTRRGASPSLDRGRGE